MEVIAFKAGSGHRTCTVRSTSGYDRSVSRGDLEGAAAPVTLTEKIVKVAGFMMSTGALRITYKDKPAILSWLGEYTFNLNIFVFKFTSRRRLRRKEARVSRSA